MIRQVFCVEHYWKVIIYYNVDGDFLFPIFKELEGIGYSPNEIRKVIRQLIRGKVKGVTCSNGVMHISIVLFAMHDDIYDYINSLVHEAEHIKQAMLRAYYIRDEGEPPAYTVGYLVQRMWEVFGRFLY